MEFQRLHDWDLQPRDAISLQTRLATDLISDSPSPLERIRIVAGVDVSIKSGRACACVVALNFPDLDIIETVTVSRPVSFPYMPGLLTFREGPVLELAFRDLACEPDVFIFDGMGQLHPRRMGIAAHLGLWLQRPTIGCGKSHLIGEYQMPGQEKGCRCPITVNGEIRGAVLRTRSNVKPVFVSVGHMSELESAVDLVLACTPKFRLPRPIRQAHLGASKACESG